MNLNKITHLIVLIVFSLSGFWGVSGPFNQPIRWNEISNRAVSSLSISELYFQPQDANSEAVKIRTCTTGDGGIGITMRVSVNTANDGSSSGSWDIVKEQGSPCFNDIDAPVWYTLNYGDGPHRVRVEAHGLQTDWSGAVVREDTYTLPHRRPSGVGLVAPVPASKNTREAIIVNSRSVLFKWEPSLRANSYTLSISANPNPQADPSPTFSQTFAASTTEYTVNFSQDYPVLYWQVVASNDKGNTASGDQLFGVIASTYSISGHVYNGSSTPIAGVTVSDGIGGTATTDSNGNYTLTKLTAGSYTITPTLAGYSFTPASQPVTVGPDQTGVNFTGTQAGPSWNFLLYLAGDTQAIDFGAVFTNMYHSVQELEKSSNPNVRVIALIDGPNALDSFRVTFTPQAAYQQLGEKQMDNPTTLSDFITQARSEFPADHTYLVIADHANGIQGIAWDTTTNANKSAYLTPTEIRQALATATNSGQNPIDVLHFDGCSFGLFENAYMAKDYVHYLVASENIGWAVFAYSQYRAGVTASTGPAQLATMVAQKYSEVVGRQQYPYTISALDLSRLDSANTALSAFADQLVTFSGVNQTNRNLLMSLRSQSQKFDSGGSPSLEINNDDSYVDLVDFAARVKQQSGDAGLASAADTLLSALTGPQPLVIYVSKRSGSFDYGGPHTWTLDGTFGVSIYYPAKSAGAIYGDYVSGAIFPTFQSQNHWILFLQAGLPPLGPGEPLPSENYGPLAPLTVPGHQIFVPAIRRQ
jgi:hypothetical protein